MHVDDAIDAIVRRLHFDPPCQCAEIVAEVKVAGRLHAGEDARFEGHQDYVSGCWEDCWPYRAMVIAAQGLGKAMRMRFLLLDCRGRQMIGSGGGRFWLLIGRAIPLPQASPPSISSPEPISADNANIRSMRGLDDNR